MEKGAGCRDAARARACGAVVVRDCDCMCVIVYGAVFGRGRVCGRGAALHSLERLCAASA